MLYHFHQELLGLYDSEYLNISESIENLEDAVDEQDIEMIEDIVIDLRQELRFVIQFCRILVQMVVVDIHSVRNLLNFYDFHVLKIPEYVEELEYEIDNQDDLELHNIIIDMRRELQFVIAFCAKLEEQP